MAKARIRFSYAALACTSSALALTLASGCSAPVDEEGDPIATTGLDEGALMKNVSMSGQCIDRGPGPRNVVTKVTPVTFRVQVYKTLVRVWIPETSPGVEFEPLGHWFHGREEYVPSPYGGRPGTKYYRYFKLPHPTAADPELELSGMYGPYASSLRCPYGSQGSYHTGHSIMIQRDNAGVERLNATFSSEIHCESEFGFVSNKTLPSVSCIASGVLPAY